MDTLCTPAAKPNDSLLQWLLREAVRANPLYVISAACLAYALQEFMVEIDPQVGKLGGVVASLTMLHLYEIAVLCVATIVLKARTRGGLDMHGLLIVAGIYMGVTFIALDELITIKPEWSLALALGGLLLVGCKLAWYARLPGVYLPLKYRLIALGILAAHEFSPFINSQTVSRTIEPAVAQGWGWMAGWISLLPVLWLICVESHRAPKEATIPNDEQRPEDPLATRMCGAWLVCIAAIVSVVHLYVSDWIFDVPADRMRILPAAMVLSAAIILLRRKSGALFGWTDWLLVSVPFLMIEELWSALPAERIRWDVAFVLGAAMQVRMASVAFYCALALGTRCARFYAGLMAPFGIPFFLHGWRERESIPNFRAITAAGLGFATLAMGMVVSLFRERLLRKFDPNSSTHEKIS